MNEWKIVGKDAYKYAGDGAITGIKLGITKITEPEDRKSWCWVVVSEIVGKYLNPQSTKTQEEVVQAVLGEVADLGGGNEEVKKAIEYICGDKIKANVCYDQADEYGGEIYADHNYVKKLDEKKPFILYVITGVFRSGHALVCYGYEKIGDQYMLFLYDPIGFEKEVSTEEVFGEFQMSEEYPMYEFHNLIWIE